LKKYVLTVDVVVEVPDRVDPETLCLDLDLDAVYVDTTDDSYHSDDDGGGAVGYTTKAVAAVEELS
jgi:hypothetical protein